MYGRGGGGLFRLDKSFASEQPAYITAFSSRASHTSIIPFDVPLKCEWSAALPLPLPFPRRAKSLACSYCCCMFEKYFSLVRFDYSVEGHPVQKRQHDAITKTYIEHDAAVNINNTEIQMEEREGERENSIKINQKNLNRENDSWRSRFSRMVFGKSYCEKSSLSMLYSTVSCAL